jgi:hypothetical protein
MHIFLRRHRFPPQNQHFKAFSRCPYVTHSPYFPHLESLQDSRSPPEGKCRQLPVLIHTACGYHGDTAISRSLDSALKCYQPRNSKKRYQLLRLSLNHLTTHSSACPLERAVTASSLRPHVSKSSDFRRRADKGVTLLRQTGASYVSVGWDQGL